MWCTVFQSAKTNLNVEQVFFSIARDIKTRLAETDSKPEVQITVLSYVPNSILFNVLRDLFLFCRTRPSRLTRQKAPTHQRLQDLLAAGLKGLLGPGGHCLFDIIQFLLVCYRKNVKKKAMTYDTDLVVPIFCLPFFEATTLAFDVAVAIAGSYCTLDFQSVEPLATVCNHFLIHAVGLLWFLSSNQCMEITYCCCGVNLLLFLHACSNFCFSPLEYNHISFTFCSLQINN